MLKRTILVGLAVAAAAALLTALVSPEIGPRASRADLGSASMSIEAVHRQVDHSKLPTQAIPEP